jgi:hypothetical protein
MKKEAEARVHGVGVKDPNLKVDFVLQGKTLTVSARYEEVVKHPLVNKITRFRFSESSSTEVGFMNLKPEPSAGGGDEEF